MFRAAFFKHRARRVETSTGYSVAHKNSPQPSISFINIPGFMQLLTSFVLVFGSVKGYGEVKCPYSNDDCDFDSYTAEKSSCLEKFDRKIQFYYRLQQQLRITGRQFGDFVVSAFSSGSPMFFIERIFPDIDNWEITVL